MTRSMVAMSDVSSLRTNISDRPKDLDFDDNFSILWGGAFFEAWPGLTSPGSFRVVFAE